MLSALFQGEISALESQIAQLQTRIAALVEAERSSEAALAVLQSAVEKVST